MPITWYLYSLEGRPEHHTLAQTDEPGHLHAPHESSPIHSSNATAMTSYFWRVEDEFSRVTYERYLGHILSTSTCAVTFDYNTPGERHQLRAHLRSHLD